MRLVSFDDHRVGVRVGPGIRDVTAVLPDFLSELPEQRINWLIRHWDRMSQPIAEAAADESAPVLEIGGVHLLSPNPAPRHVFALPANYAAHIGELGARAVTKGSRSAREQGFFLKAPGSLSGAGDAIMLPQGSTRRFDHECELAVVIARDARDVPRAEAASFVFGYSCLIDLTMRIEGELQEERSMRKSFETFTPLGPELVTADEVGDIADRESRLWVNGEIRQSARLTDMIVGVEEAIELISSVLTLRAGDVIAMGTPAGVGPIAAGDTIAIEIDGIGSMALPVRERIRPAPRPY